MDDKWIGLATTAGITAILIYALAGLYVDGLKARAEAAQAECRPVSDEIPPEEWHRLREALRDVQDKLREGAQ